MRSVTSFILRLALVVCLAPAGAWAQSAAACAEHYAGGMAPHIVKASLLPRTQALCFKAYALMHSGLSRTPLWSAEHLVRANIEAATQLTRVNTFHAEERVAAADRAELADYARSGYDRGHMSPNGDMPDRTAQGESFSLANMVPQIHANNAGVWAGIEGAARRLALQEGNVYVVSGPAFIGRDIASLNGRVLIPTHLWKVVYSPLQRRAGAYLITNDETKTYSSLSVTELEKILGFNLLPGVSQQVRDAGMTLPAPSGKGSGRGAQSASKKGVSASEMDTAPEAEYSVSDFARSALNAVLKTMNAR